MTLPTYMPSTDARARLVARLVDLEAVVEQIRSSMRTLAAATIDRGGLTVQNGGGINVEDGGRIVARDGFITSVDTTTNGSARMQNASFYLIPDSDDLSRFGYMQIEAGEDAGNNLWMGPPRDSSEPNTTRFTMRGRGGGFGGAAWLLADDLISIRCRDGGGNPSGRIYASAQRIDLSSGDLRLYELPTTSASANLRLNIDAGGIPRVYYNTSSRRFKTAIDDAVIDPAEVAQVRVRTWQDIAELERDPDTKQRHVGAIAEELWQFPTLRQFVELDLDGEPVALKYDRMWALALVAARAVAERVTKLEAENAALKSQLADVLARLDALEAA